MQKQKDTIGRVTASREGQKRVYLPVNCEIPIDSWVIIIPAEIVPKKDFSKAKEEKVSQSSDHEKKD